MPNLSTFTSIQPYLIAERSEATPGLFNNLVSVVSQNLDQINTDAFALSAAAPPGALNAASLPGSGITQIQAAIDKAKSLAIPIIYVPTNLLPYNAAQISFSTLVQMVREGGAWDVYDIKAYGANPVLAQSPDVWNTAAIQAAIHGANGAGGGVVYIPAGNYAISSLTVPRKVTIRGSGGGRYLDSTIVSELYQGSANTTMMFLADQGGSGVVVENMQLSASGNSNNLGGIRIAGMTFCLLRAVSISGTSAFAVQIEGGNDANMNSIIDCAITMSSQGTAIDIEGGPSGMDTTPYMTGCYLNCDAPTAWFSFKSTVSGVAPDSPLIFANRCITSSTVTALYGLMTNARFLGNRFEAVAGGLNVTLAPPTGSQAAGEFIGNSYGITGGALVWQDSAATPSTRFQEITPTGVINAIPGNAVAPPYAFGSENSLGFYRSAASTIGLSYGALALPTATALAPSLTFSSESSLGLYRSGTSSLALSYGTLRLPLNSEFLLIGAGGTPIPLRIFESGGDFFITANRTKAFVQDNTAAASWQFHMGANAGVNDLVDISHTSAGGSAIIRFSLDSTGNLGLGGGISTNPSFQFISETSLGLYRSAASTLALSYGTFDLTTTVASIGSLKIKAGTNQSCGTAVLGSNGSVNVANTYVKTGDLIFLTDQTPGGTLGDLEIGGIRNSSGFTITSTSVTDTSTVAWLIVRPG